MKFNSDVKILDIDLSNETIEERILPQEITNLYPDGTAFGLYLLLQEVDQDVNPLAPANILIFTYMESVGSKKPGDYLVITTKSPLNNSIGDSKVMSALPNLLRIRDIYAIIFRGKAKNPVYLYMEGENYSIRGAQAIWGRVSDEAARIIKKEVKEDALEIALIGPAGENMVKYSCIISMTNRASGRSGTGAVMGSKNLKAIVIKKSK